MAEQTLNPFKSQDIALAQAIITSCDQIDEFFRKCQDCGTNYDALRAQNAAHREFAKGILANFGSNLTNG